MAENFFGITDLGKQRDNNEDAFIAHPTADGKYIIACVIDGVGGYAGGEIAAEIARETVLQRLSKPNGEIIPLLVDAFNRANEKIWQEKQLVKEHSSMACVLTLALIDIAANQFYYAHLGDTRLYLFRDKSLVKISRDQSFVGFLEDSGRLTEKEAMSHPKRNEIDKALGFKHLTNANNDDIETGQSPFLPGDMLLLCSDGLTDVIDREVIIQIISGASSLKVMGANLVEAANHAGGKDNITVVLVKNDKQSQQHAATRPVENIAQKKTEKVIADEQPKLAEELPARRRTRTINGFSVFLIVLVIALGALCIWQYQNYNNNNESETKAVAPAPIETKPAAGPSQQEIKLQNLLNNGKGKLVVLSDTAFNGPVIISEPITISRDSLHIKAKGTITFKSASGFNGPAFIIAAKNKGVLLDSVSFQDFGTAISGYNQAISLKNVRFKNCKTPLQSSPGFADNKYVSGSTIVGIFKTDSLPKNK